MAEKKNEKKLREGYTTGSCSAAASIAATILCLGGEKLETVNLMTPRGKEVEIPICHHESDNRGGYCCAIKDAGDDPDITDGALICSRVYIEDEWVEPIPVNGGVGVGRVTKPGLQCKPGNPAINPVPMKMIRENVIQTLEDMGVSEEKKGFIRVEISIPEGEKLAAKTFNPKLGIVGGISILGTSGIVEPMSDKALIATIEAEISVKKAEGEQYIIATPGNYGEKFIRESGGLAIESAVKSSNFIGDTIGIAVKKGIEGLLFVGHIGKFIKVAGGAMNTHSKYGDERINLFKRFAMGRDADEEVIRRIEEAVMTEECIDILKDAGCLDPVMEDIMDAIERVVEKEAGRKELDGNSNFEIAVVVYSTSHGMLGKTSKADYIVERIAGKSRGKIAEGEK